jgi:hypothetical protein
MPNGAFRPGWYHELLKQSWYWDLVEKCDDGLPDALRSVRGAYETSTVDATVREGETFEDESLDTVSTLVHVTGHHLEWMVMLPRELQPDAAVIERAVSFCAQSLRVAGTEELSRHNCPYNHAARMVRLFGTTANQS